MNRYFKIWLLLVIALSPAININAQNKYMPANPYWEWDGITHWTRYMITNPGFMGPNALPVPELGSGILVSENRFQAGYAYHYNKMDPTHNLFTRLIVPVYKDKINLEFSIVPLEIFNMDSSLRWERHTHLLKGEGVAFGDLYFGTNIQLVRNHQSLPDIVVSMVCKTTSGGRLAEARYTDTPGYYFDLNFGKQIGSEKSNGLKARITGMMGFFSWQTYLANNRQNDAFLYGAGLLLRNNSWEFHNNISGYIGYMDLGDQPVVFRSDLTIKGTKSDFRISYNYGINDFDYHSFKMSMIWHWVKKQG